MESVYSKRIRAGKRRTYFFDVRATRGNDYYITITESRKKFNENGYDRHKIFLYKEDFNKFLKALTEAVDYVKTELMPNFDFDAYNHDQVQEHQENQEHQEHQEHDTEDAGANHSNHTNHTPAVEEVEKVSSNGAGTAADAGEEVDKW